MSTEYTLHPSLKTVYNFATKQTTNFSVTNDNFKTLIIVKYALIHVEAEKVNLYSMTLT